MNAESTGHFSAIQKTCLEWYVIVCAALRVFESSALWHVRACRSKRCGSLKRNINCQSHLAFRITNKRPPYVASLLSIHKSAEKRLKCFLIAEGLNQKLSKLSAPTSPREQTCIRTRHRLCCDCKSFEIGLFEAKKAFYI